MSKIAEKVAELARPVVEEEGCRLWDVEFVREAGERYLRLYIDKAGGVEPATPSAGSGEYAVRYWATYINNERVREIDPLNMIFYVNGVDYMAQVRKALGM